MGIKMDYFLTEAKREEIIRNRMPRNPPEETAEEIKHRLEENAIVDPNNRDRRRDDIDDLPEDEMPPEDNQNADQQDGANISSEEQAAIERKAESPYCAYLVAFMNPRNKDFKD